MFEVGSQVLRESNGWVGTILSKRQLNEEWRVEVRWASGLSQWIPTDHLSAVEKVARPKEVLTSPVHLRNLRKILRAQKSKQVNAIIARRWREKNLADTLAGLSERPNKRESRNRNKAKTLIERSGL